MTIAGDAAARLESALPNKALQLLRSFSKKANKGVLGPKDDARFYSFIVITCREKTTLSLDDLRLWFKHDGWSKKDREKLMSWYAPIKSFLEASDRGDLRTYLDWADGEQSPDSAV